MHAHALTCLSCVVTRCGAGAHVLELKEWSVELRLSCLRGLWLQREGSGSRACAFDVGSFVCVCVCYEMGRA